MADFFSGIFDGIMKLILSIQWYDIADIALVAFAIYYCIKLMRQTRAFNLVKGIVLMGFIFFVVSTLNMSASSYLFSHIFSDIVIVMILLFQPEIRHAIESFGRGDFRKFSIFLGRSSNFTGDEMRACSASITKAVSNMSDKKIGALIVIEGKTLLGEIISTGLPVDSAVSTAVIENIFFPKAPLHDGAMIIRDGRIHSAGCILPLTQRDIGKELGTRHRAAVGITENTDALVVIVSEETGTVSIAKGGSLERKLTIGELNEILNEHMVPKEIEKQGILSFKRRKK